MGHKIFLYWTFFFTHIYFSSFFLILTFLISDESGQTPTRQKSSSLSGQFKSFKKFNKCKSWEIIFNKLILFGISMLWTGLFGPGTVRDERIKSKDFCWIMDRWTTDWWFMDRLDRLAINVSKLGTDHECPESPAYFYSTHCIPQQSKLHQTSWK